MEAALEVLSSEQPDADIAEVSAQLGRLLFFVGRADEAQPHLERLLAVAERLMLPETLAQALNTKSLVLLTANRPVESDALIEKALAVALGADRHGAALRAYFNLAERQADVDKIDEALETYRVGLAYARRVGDKFYDLSMQAGVDQPAAHPGPVGRGPGDRGDRDRRRAPHDASAGRSRAGSGCRGAGPAWGCRGCEGVPGPSPRRGRLRERPEPGSTARRARGHRAGRGRPQEALALARRALESHETLGLIARAPIEGLIESLEAAFALRDEASIDELLEFATHRTAGDRSALLDGQPAACSRPDSSSARGEDDKAVTMYAAALTMLEETRNVFWQATVRLEAAEHHLEHGRPAEAARLVAQARPALEQLGVRPSIDRADRVDALAGSSAPTG